MQNRGAHVNQEHGWGSRMEEWPASRGGGIELTKLSVCEVFVCFCFFFFFLLFRAVSAAYGSSQAMGPIGTIAASLHHSHSNARSDLYHSSQ